MAGGQSKDVEHEDRVKVDKTIFFIKISLVVSDFEAAIRSSQE